MIEFQKFALNLEYNVENHIASKTTKQQNLKKFFTSAKNNVNYTYNNKKL